MWVRIPPKHLLVTQFALQRFLLARSWLTALSVTFHEDCIVVGVNGDFMFAFDRKPFPEPLDNRLLPGEPGYREGSKE